MSKIYKKIIALDVEATHLDVEKGRLIEFGAVKADLIFDPDKQKIAVEFGESFESLINPEIEVPIEILELTGIKQEDLDEAPVWKEVKGKVEDFASTGVLLGHNVKFDIDYLKNQGITLKNNKLDTLEISQTLLPTVESHSLNFIAESLGVLIGVSHRAKEDSKTTLLLLAEILNQFLVLPDKLQRRVIKLLQKSEVDYVNLLTSLPNKPVKVKKFQPLAAEKPKQEKKVLSKIADNTIYNLPLGFGDLVNVYYELTDQKSSLVCVSSPYQLEELSRDVQLPRAFYSLCKRRFEKAADKHVLSSAEAKILVKLLIADEKRNFGDLSQIRWTPDERSVIWQLRTDYHTDCGGYRKKAEQQLEKQGNVTDLYNLFDLVFNWQIDLSEKDLVLFDLAEIESSLTYYLTQVWNLKKVRGLLQLLFPLEKTLTLGVEVSKEAESFANELDLFFGILHLVYLNKKNDFSETLVVDGGERNSQRFEKLYSSAEKLLQKTEKFQNYLDDRFSFEHEELLEEKEVLKGELAKFEKIIRETFIDPDNRKIYWLKFNSEWVDLNSAPKEIDKHFSKIKQSVNKLSIVDTELPELAFDYFTKRLGLSEFDVEKVSLPVSRPKLRVKIDKDLKQPKKLNIYLQEKKQSAVLVLQNANQLSKFFEYFSQNNDTHEVTAYKHSGSLSAIRAKVRAGDLKTEKPTLLMLTSFIARKAFNEFPWVEILYLQKLPFSPPGVDPAAKLYTADNDFIENSLPKAVQSVHELFHKFAVPHYGEKDTELEVILSDERAISQYDEKFMEYFDSHPGIETI